MSDSEIRYIGDVQRLQLQPGDILVITVETRASDKLIERIRAEFEMLVPSYKVVVISDAIKLGVLGK